MKHKNRMLILLLSVFLTGCDDLFEPAKENIRDKEASYEEPAFAEGLLLNGYLRMPDYETYSYNDVATDDAVSNDFNNNYLRMASGSWASNNNPMDVWTRNYNAILYLNQMIDEAAKAPWAADPDAHKLFTLRITGEAYGLRALFMYHLLQAHAGFVNGKLLGVPVVTDPVDKISDFNLVRPDFKDCIEAIYRDLDIAGENLPMDYDDLNVNTGQIPPKYIQQGITDISIYNRVMGQRFRQRMSARIAKSIRARVALLAASPAFLDGADNTWVKTAEYAADVLSYNRGLEGLAAAGWTWYTNDAEMTAIANASNPPEIVWRHRTLTHTNISSTPEKQQFPPTLYGNGRVNPTQNLVDAFPMKNGYPISDTQHSGYDKTSPYSNRDPRLDAYIVYNGSKVGAVGATISMTTGDDAVDATSTSTRTGYYMRKLTNQATNLNPSTQATRMMYVARIRYTELYLIYAEAANEAYGPDGKASNASYSARDVIKAIRKRAGVGGNDDPYLASVTSKEAMRELIRNERRLELCFEGHRFWDLRRWKVSLDKLNEPVRGIKGSNEAGTATFDFSGPYELKTESRQYKNYMYYGPIPYGETLKWSNLVQNEGW